MYTTYSRCLDAVSETVAAADLVGVTAPLACDADSDSDTDSGTVPLCWDVDSVSALLSSQLASVSIPLVSDTDDAEFVAVTLLLSADTVTSDVLVDTSLLAWVWSGTGSLPPDTVTLRATVRRLTAGCL